MPSDRGRRPGEPARTGREDDPRAAWVIDANVMAGLRLGAASGALSSGDADRALAEAELLLHRTPDDIDALAVVGRAAVRTGDGGMAQIALERVVDARPTAAEAWALLALARLLTADADGAVRAAEEATRLAPDAPLGWHHLAVALERCGRGAAAEQASEVAERLDPRVFVRPQVWDEGQWTRALTAARGLLPPVVARFYARVPLRWGSFPEEALLRVSSPPLSPFIDASIDPGHGTSPGRSKLPAAVVLYRSNLARPACALDELARRIALALARRAEDWLTSDD